MNVSALAQIITAVAALVAAIGTFINGYNLRRVEKNTNSKMDELLDTTKKASKAEGVLQEKERVK